MPRDKKNVHFLFWQEIRNLVKKKSEEEELRDKPTKWLNFFF